MNWVMCGLENYSFFFMLTLLLNHGYCIDVKLGLIFSALNDLSSFCHKLFIAFHQIVFVFNVAHHFICLRPIVLC